MPSISNRDLADLEVAVPSMSEQKQTLITIERLADDAQRLKSIYEQKVALLDALKASALDQAFNGQL